MTQLSDVLKRVGDLGNNNSELYSVIGTASNIRESESLLDVTPLAGTPILDVRINPVGGSTLGFRLIPAEESNVIVTFLNENEAYLAQADEIEKILVEVGSSTLLIEDGLAAFNGGSNGGLINVEDLVTQINRLENDINQLKTLFAGWIVLPGDGGTALKTATAPWYGSQITPPTTRGNIEDENVKH